MAMTLRLPAELDAELDAIAAAEHISKHALVLQGAELIVQRRSRGAQLADVLDFVTTHDAALLERLADA
ncbi:ribbon-helix-helix protein, CopG family [Glutamicibacter protophormiae]|uniref:ribbon-helix-helix protein, CopG family n=1 Tax=Glutamicibacter protophormiae TaxID=37930 RepID=UPI003A8FFC43